MKIKLEQLILHALLLVGLVFSIFAAKFSLQIEAFYSSKIYYMIIRPYSLLTGLVPVSLAELIIISIIGLLAYKTGRAVLAFSRNPKLSFRELFNVAFRFTRILAVIYLTFNLMWGLNYHRLTFAETSDLSVEPASEGELAELAKYLITWANELREEVKEDNAGIMMLDNGIRDMFSRSHLGYEQAAEIYPKLSGSFGRPKGVILSSYWSYTGISGIFFPFTAEASINTNMPHFMLPSTTNHEMAHQRGFDREDEANFIAYLTSTLHPDPDFKYSGVMLALIYTMKEMYGINEEIWRELRLLYSEGLNRDLGDWQTYWANYEGLIDNISTRINNAYLMANRQEEGVNSYGRMIDLLLADFRK